jgi:hypothetical protein
MKDESMIDLDHARLNPAAVFDTPGEVLQHVDVSREQKIDILRRWALDAHALQVAEDENMTAPRPTPSRLDVVLKALHDREAEFHTE